MFISIKENPKRVTAILLVLALLLSFCGISVYADEQPMTMSFVFTDQNYEEVEYLKAGQTVYLGVKLEDYSPIVSYGWRIRYDKEILDFNESLDVGSGRNKEFENGVDVASSLAPSISNPVEDQGYIICSFATDLAIEGTDLNDGGIAFYLAFTVLKSGTAKVWFDTTPGTSFVWSTDAQNGSAIPTTLEECTFTSVTTGVNLTTTEVTVDGTNGETISPMAFDSDVEKIENGLTWSITGENGSGVTINSSTGEITIDAKAKAGEYTVTATATATGGDSTFGEDSNTASATFTVSRAASVAESLSITPETASEITIPADNAEATSTTFTATVTDQFDDTMLADIQWSVSAEDGTVLSGITIENGTLKVGNEAKSIITDTNGKTLTVTAKCGTLTDTATITVKRAASVATSVDIYKDGGESAIESDTIAIPQSGSTNVTYTAKVLDQYGSEMAGEVTWSTEGTVPSSVTASNGTVTVPAGASTGSFSLKAKSGSASDSVKINVASISFGGEAAVEDALDIAGNPTYGMTWGEIVKVAGEITANVGGTPVEGEYSVKDAGATPDAGENKEYTILFTSVDGTYSDVEVYTGTLTIAPKAVTVTGITVGDKEYDGNNTATVNFTGEGVSVTGTIGEDVVTVTGATGTFADANVGTGKTVTVEVELDNSNYTVKDLEPTASITAKTLTVDVSNVDVSKVYDGTTAPGTVAGSASVTGTVGSESVTVNVTAGDYHAKDVGSSYTVELTLELAGDAAKNYVLGSATATITDAAITACNEFNDATAKTQNVVVGVGTFTAPSFTGIGGEAVNGTVTYTYGGSTQSEDDIVTALAALSAGKTATIGYSFVAGGNYTGTITDEIAVTMVDIAFTGVDEAIAVASDAVYGDTWADIVTVDASKIDAAVGTEKVEGTYTVENSNDRPNAGSATYRVLFNSNDCRYVNVEVASDTVDVAKKPVSITGLDVADKIYDGNTSAIVSGTATLDGVLAGDTVSVAAGTASFADKNVGTEKNVIFRDYSLSGTDANNYELSAQPSATANITAKPVTITGVAAANKTYDGTTTAQITGTAVISGKVGDDDVEVVNGTAAFADANVGNGISITFSGFSLSGADADNYELTAQPVSVTANITKADYTNAPELNINIIMNQADAQTGTLTALNFFGGNMPTGATITSVALNGTDSNVIEGISVDDGSLTYASEANITTEGTVETYNVTVSTKNYNDITATLTFTTVAKTPVTISGVSVADKVYNGQAASYTGTPAAAADGEAVEVSAYTYTWQSADGAVLSSAPVNAGSYKLVIAVAENDQNYVGSTTVNFTISKATVTITVADKEAYVGSDMPELSYTVSGLAAGETLATNPTLTCNADMDKAGEYAITASGAAVPATGNYNEDIVYVSGTLTVSHRPINVGPTYEINVADSENGSVKASLGNASEGSVITLTVTPDEGYRLGSITVIDENGTEVEVRRSGSEYKFTMPDGDVRVSARFVRDTGALPFNDVNAGDWFYDYVEYVYNNGIMDGVDNGVFSPNTETTRGMVVTILYRLAGEPNVRGGNDFSDVASGAYYADAVTWASNAGIVNGTSATTFSPNALVTREQFAAMLYRYMSYIGEDVSASTNLNRYTDAGSVSAYAETAMSWAVAEGIINGRTATTLAPAGNCTRAEVAAMITRVFG